MPTLAEMMAKTAKPEPTGTTGNGSVATTKAGVSEQSSLGGLKLGGGFKLKVPGVGAAPEPTVAPPNDSIPSVVEESKPVPATPVVGLSLQGLAGLDTGSVGIPGLELAEIDPGESAGYLDEVPAAAPVRDLPEELDKQQQAFIDSLDSIYRLHDDPEMFVNMVRKIMSEMQERPELCVLLAASKGQDSNAIIRGLRQSAGMAQVKKQESKAKRSGKPAKPQSALVDSALQTLQGLAGLEGFD